MSKLRVIIADDERPARELLKSTLREFDEIEIVGEAENGADAVELIKTARPDLAILDLKMPELSGLEAVKMLRKNQMPLVAFVTAHDEYAVEAFELNAVDYLLKPVEGSRLAETLARASERLENADWRAIESERVRSASEAYADSQTLERIPVKVHDEYHLLPAAEVASIVADGELLRITTSTNRRFVINHRLKDIELRLDPQRFIRLSRGALVNLDFVDHISPLPGGTYAVMLTNGQELTTSRLQSRVLRS